MSVSLLLVEYCLMDDGNLYDNTSHLITNVYGSLELVGYFVQYRFIKEILIYEEIQNEVPFKEVVLDNQKLNECKIWLDQQYKLALLESTHGIINFKEGGLQYNEALNKVDPDCSKLWYKEIIELIDLKLTQYYNNDNVLIHVSY